MDCLNRACRECNEECHINLRGDKVTKMNISKLRGHDIEYVNGEWRYCDTKEPTAGNYQNRPCGHCGRHFTKDGHDGCLEKLPGVMNACCGHGNIRESYVQFLDKSSINGYDAMVIQNILKKYRDRW